MDSMDPMPPHPALPALPLPDDDTERLLLVALRRMARHGIRDAHAANLFLCRFGIRFRAPLVLLRAFMVDLAQVSRRTIIISPCCALRMTPDEQRLLDALRAAAVDPASGARHLQTLSGTAAVGRALSTAMAFSGALLAGGVLPPGR